MDYKYEIRGLGLIWNILRKNYSEDIVNKIKNMKMLENCLGAVFDV